MSGINTTINKNDNPDFLNDYLDYMRVVKQLSPRTVIGYYQEIRLFLRWIIMKDSGSENCVLQDIQIKKFTLDRLKKVTLSEIYQFFYYCADELNDSPYSRERKSSALKGLFKYLYLNLGIIDSDPTEKLEIPRHKKTQPRFLTLDECNKLLAVMENDDSPSAARDICMVTLLLNCGMRLSELTGLNISDISFDEMRMRVLGKENKERFLFLNKSCMNALRTYLEVRKQSETDPDALFTSSRGKRITNRRVEQIVNNALKKAGLAGRGLSVHKLRHTAATLMYTYGGADMMDLKEILGHASTSTTEIYTHVSTEAIRGVTESMPFEPKKEKK